MSNTADNPIASNLQCVQVRINAALKEARRPAGAAQLLAVSKTKPAHELLRAYEAGQRAFGENYLQEALEKQQQLKELNIEWHFIGPIQSNKTRAIAENFDWVHSVEREKIARRLSEQRPEGMPPINVCLQVNLDNEATKSGISLAELPAMLESVAQLPNICVRGLMAIPAKREGFETQKAALEPLAAALEGLRAKHPELDTLSMGMSADLEAAISCGATYVRIGTDIFGARG